MAGLFYWEVDNDPGTGRTFFVYRPTGQSQWDLPDSLLSSADVMGYNVELDPGSGRAYFAEVATGITNWDVPPALAALSPGLPDSVTLLAEWLMEEDPSTGRPYFVHRNSDQTQWELPSQISEGAMALGWSVELDPGTGRAFYIYEPTGASQWEIPASLSPLKASTDGIVGIGSTSGGSNSRPTSRGSRASRASRPASRASRPASRASRPASRGSNVSGLAGSQTSGSRPGSRAGGRRRKQRGAGAMKTANGGSPWQENKDSSGSVFWFNAETGEMTTECPPELQPKEKEENEDGGGDGKREGDDALRGDPTRRSEEDWATVRSVSSILSVWGAWEAWKDPEGNKFWFDTKTGRTTLEDPLALSTDDEEYMDTDAEDETIGWVDIRRSLYLAAMREAKEAEGGDNFENVQTSGGVEGKRESKVQTKPSRALSEDEDSDLDEGAGASSNEGRRGGGEKGKAATSEAAGILNEGKKETSNDDEEIEIKKVHQRDGKTMAADAFITEDAITDISLRHGLRERRHMCREDWMARVVRRQEERRALRRKLGDMRPKPTRTDQRINDCLRHPLGFLNFGNLDYEEMPRRQLRQVRRCLRHLSLQENGLRMVNESDIEKRLSTCPHLEVLNLRQNMLTKLPDNFGLLTGLRALSVANNTIEELPLSVFLMTALTSLSLAHNRFNIMPSELGVKVMRQYRVWEMGWGNLTQLTSLDLSANRFNQLPTHIEGSQRDAQFGNLWSLTHLDMSDNFFEDLPEEFYALNSLTDLSIADNQMHGSLSDEFGKMDALLKLDLANNRISGLGEGLCTLQYLMRLQLRNNKLDCLPENIGGLASLTELDASHNQITEIPESIGAMRQLERLDLSVNSIERTPVTLCGLQNLRCLLLSHNKIQHVAGRIGRLRELRKLCLDHNEITAAGLWEGHIDKMMSLTYLSVGWNNIDVLVASMFDPPPPNLQVLDVRYNMLSKLPDSILCLSTLKSLLAGRNRLTRLIDDIGTLKMLTTLDVSGNRLGELPASMALLTQLKGTIDLSDNMFVERPDDVLWSIPGVQHVIMNGCPLRPEGLSITQSLINGDLASQAHDLEGAIEHYSTVLEQSPLHFEACQKRARLYKELGFYEKAIEDLTTAMRTRFDDASLFYGRGMLNLITTPPRSEAALLDFKNALARNEVFWAAMVGMARALIQVGQYGEAIAFCRTVVDGDMEPECVRNAKFVWACAEFRQGEPVAAIEFFDDFLDPEKGSIPPNEYEIMLMRGLCLRDLGDTKAAIEDFSSVIVAFDEAREAEAERARLEELHQNSQAAGNETGEDSEDSGASESGSDSDEEKDEDEDSDSEADGDDNAGALAHVVVEEPRIPVTEKQLKTALMNRSGCYATMGSQRNSTLDYERIYKRKTNWKLIRDAERKRENKESGEDHHHHHPRHHGEHRHHHGSQNRDDSNNNDDKEGGVSQRHRK